ADAGAGTDPPLRRTYAVQSAAQSPVRPGGGRIPTPCREMTRRIPTGHLWLDEMPPDAHSAWWHRPCLWKCEHNDEHKLQSPTRRAVPAGPGTGLSRPTPQPDR